MATDADARSSDDETQVQIDELCAALSDCLAKSRALVTGKVLRLAAEAASEAVGRPVVVLIAPLPGVSGYAKLIGYALPRA